jgi:3',5'-cyclic-AMP phosphodiesterase
MKKIITVISALIVILIGAAAFKYFNDESSSVVGVEASPNTSLAFAVIGDVHDNTGNFQVAIDDMRRINDKMDALIMNGDSVDQGLDNQYDSMKKILEKNSSKLPETIIKNIGNHEFFDYDHGANSAEDVKNFINKYLDFAREENVYHDKWIKGYHFISLGSEDGNTPEAGTTKAHLSDNQLKWFKEKLAEKYEAKKPIFVFLHQHLSTGMGGWIGTDQSKKLRGILEQYPEAIIFTSHTHASFEVNNVTVNQPFTMAHTGAVSYTFKTSSDGKRERANESYGLYIEVFGNKVAIKGRDFNNKVWVFEKEINSK